MAGPILALKVGVVSAIQLWHDIQIVIAQFMI